MRRIASGRDRYEFLRWRAATPDYLVVLGELSFLARRADGLAAFALRSLVGRRFALGFISLGFLGFLVTPFLLFGHVILAS
jgi:hypothetical protein